jgi:hypothetical protein
MRELLHLVRSLSIFTADCSWRAAFAVAILCLGLPGAASALSGHFEAAHGEFLLRLDDGRVLRREALVGATLIMNTAQGQVKARIDGVDEDAAAPGGSVPLYRLSVEDPTRGTFHNICQADARGRQAGFPISRGEGFDFTCTSGAEGKCILMGYRPWDDRTDAPMRALHRACIHMVRADYGGDGRATTRDGMLIDVYDRFGIQEPSENPMPFEAAWGADGALCVAHPRVIQNITLDDLAMRYPALNGRLGPGNCTHETMREDPRALIFNRSAAPGF